VQKKIIQVPIEESLLRALDSLCTERGVARAAVIREACRRYLADLERESQDEIYRDGYRRIPEDPALRLAQAQILGEILSEEAW